MHGENLSSTLDAPDISVVVPTRNRREILARALEALARQTLPAARFEVVVVDDGSADGTDEPTCRRAAGELSLRYLRQEPRGANAARNRALEVARGRLLLFINDDTIGVPTLLEEHLTTHEAHPGDAVAVLGRMTLSPELPRTVFSDLHLDSVFRLIDGRRELDWTWFFTCNVSVKRALLAGRVIFDESLHWHEDLELAERLRAHGLRVVYNPKALGYHHHALTESDFFRMARREGQALARWYRKAPGLREELAALGHPAVVPFRRRARFWLGDVLTHPAVFPLLLAGARRLHSRHDRLRRAVFRKLYQSTKRRAVYQEMRTP